MNVYRYVSSNPIRYRDPSGNSAVEYGAVARVAGLGAAFGAIAAAIDCALRVSASGIKEFTKNPDASLAGIYWAQCKIEVVAGAAVGGGLGIGRRAAGTLGRWLGGGKGLNSPNKLPKEPGDLLKRGY